MMIWSETLNTFTTFKLDKKNINELFIKLIEKYPLYFQEPERIKEIIYLFKLDESDVITMVIENNHVDRQYRDSYYSYFSQKYSDYERNCLRLAFFEGELKYTDFMSDISKIKMMLIGTIVLRPLNVGNIGHTLLNPHKLKIKGYVQTCKFKVSICGRKFVINAFPYLSQDNETMTCAETALFNLIQYYSEKYCEYRILMPSEILSTLESASYERVLPSQGVDDICMAKVLQLGHFHPRLYSYENDEEDSFEGLFYAYVESGIPFILGLPQHAVICIGHGSVDFKMTHHKLEDIVTCNIFEDKKIYHINTAKLVEEYIFMDDNQVPYVVSTIDKLTVQYYKNCDMSYELDDEEDIENEEDGMNIKSDFGDNFLEENFDYTEEAIQKMKKRFDILLLPLYKRIFLDASRAKSIFDENFLQNPDFIGKLQETYCDVTWGYAENNPLVWRMYLASSNSYKDFKCKTAQNTDIFKYYSSQSYPRFIWVLEIGTISTFSEKKARVEVILDATSSRNSNAWAILSIGYKEHMVFVPYVISHLQNTQINACKEDDLVDYDYDSIDWKKISEDVKQTVLTEIFKSLYYKPNEFVSDTYEIFSNSNLEEI